MKWSLPVSGRHGYKTLSKPELFQASLQPRWPRYLYIIHSLKYKLFHLELTFCHLLRVAVGVHCGMFYCKCTRGNLRHGCVGVLGVYALLHLGWTFSFSAYRNEYKKIGSTFGSLSTAFAIDEDSPSKSCCC